MRGTDKHVLNLGYAYVALERARNSGKDVAEALTIDTLGHACGFRVLVTLPRQSLRHSPTAEGVHPFPALQVAEP